MDDRIVASRRLVWIVLVYAVAMAGFGIVSPVGYRRFWAIVSGVFFVIALFKLVMIGWRSWDVGRSRNVK